MFTAQQLFNIFGFYEKDRFIHVKNEYVFQYVCVHPEPLRSDIYAGQTPIPPNIHTTPVTFMEYMLEDRTYRWAGKCATCGKVYYK